MDKVYTKSLHSVGFGRPLYHAAPNLQPGHCGYFDTNGHWHLIIDLSNHLSKDSKLVTEPPVQLGPVYGETMKWTKCNAEAEIRFAFWYKYKIGSKPSTNMDVESEICPQKLAFRWALKPQSLSVAFS